MKYTIKTVTVATIVMLFLFFESCSRQSQYYEERGILFGTTYILKYKSNKLLTKKIDSEFQKLNLSVNPFNPNSIISKINRNEDVVVDNHFIKIFNKSIEISEMSDGYFDVTISPLVNLWGFGFEKMDSISPEIIDSIKTFVGYKKVRLEKKRIIKEDPRVKLSFSAIAKGYACDVISELFEREGVHNYMVWIGGEVVTNGKNPNQDCWHVGINRPPEDEEDVMIDNAEELVIICGKKGMATSGDYRNYYIKDGKKYAHTISPKTGYPAGENLFSATIIANDCLTADAYATAFMAMGIERACKMAENISEIEYYIYYPEVDDPSKFGNIKSIGLNSILRKIEN